MAIRRRDAMTAVNEALNNLPHGRELNATQPMEQVDVDSEIVDVDRIGAAADVFLDWVSEKGLWVLGGIFAAGVLALFIYGLTRG